MFSIHNLKGLIRQSANERYELKKVYEQLPTTQCKRRALCCSLLPEITLIEALSVIDLVSNFPNDIRMHMCRKLIGYFFLNPVKIIKCPFLEGNECLIYEKRFFGCRAYGLWTREHYENLSARGRHAKIYIRMQWEKMGVSLPQEVVEFQVPYCTHIKTEDDALVDDNQLMHVFGRIDELSQQFSQWYHIFKQIYFFDMSFLITALVFGIHEAVQMKVAIVNDIVKTGKSIQFNELIEKINAGFIEELKHE